MESEMKKILIVDDDQDILLLLEMIISAHVDCKIESTTSGKSAVDLIRNNEYDVVICDYSLQDLDGCGVCKEAMMKDRSSSFILISAYDACEISCVQDLRTASSNILFLLKPFENEQLLFILRHILQDNMFEFASDKYIPVTLASVSDEFRNADIYYKINEMKIVKISKAEDDYDHERLEHYVTKGTKYFWVERSDFKEVVRRKLALQSRKIVGDDDIKINTRAPEIVHQAIRYLGIDQQVIDVSNTLIDNVIKIAKKEKKIWSLLSEVMDEKGYINQLAMLTSYTSVGMFSKSNKSPDQILYKLVTASLFQDVALPEDYFALIDLHDPDQFKQLSTVQQKAIRVHPEKACEVIEQIKGNYFDFSRMVLYHHERPGAPCFLPAVNFDNFSQYEKIFIMAVDFSTKLLKHRELNRELIEKEFKYVENVYGNGSFVKAYDSFKDLFEIA